ncbi:MAG: response regulator [Candidatus Pacebacteria bacterium]|nr:response regulator [Candidatus Paceibacterota bacterium]
MAKRILMMEDEKDLHNIYREMLECLGYEVDICFDDIEIMEKIGSSSDFDLFIFDLQYKSGDVLFDIADEVLKEIREMGISTPAVLMSGSPGNPKFVNYDKHGFILAIEKPFNLDKLAEVLNRAFPSQ